MLKDYIPPWQHLLASFLIASICVVGLGFYGHHALTKLRDEQHAQLQSVANLLNARVSTLEHTTQESLFALNTSTLQAQEELRDYTDTLATAQQKALGVVQDDLTASKQATANQLSALSGEILQVKDASETQLKALEEKVKTIKTANEDFSAVLDDVLEAVVSVTTNTGQGTGVLFDSRGYLVTNYHVVSGATAASIRTSDGKVHQVRAVAFETDLDLAVLKIEGSFDALSFGDSDDVTVGEQVIAVGNPGGLDFTVTQGIISALNRIGPNGKSYLQTDVSINPGNSGGPLVDKQGTIIGINTLKWQGFEGIGFAIPSNTVEDFAKQSLAYDLTQQAAP